MNREQMDMHADGFAYVDELSELINDLINRRRISDFASCKREIKQYFNRLKNSIDNAILHMPDMQVRNILISRHQITLTETLTNYWASLKNKKMLRRGADFSGDSGVAVYYYCINWGIQFLHYLMLYYPQHFEINRPLPSFVPYFRSKKMQNNVVVLLSSFRENRIDKRLIDVLSNYFYSFLNNKSFNHITWHHWTYAVKIASELSSRLSFLSYTDRHQEELAELLITFNFNHRPFFRFIAEKMSELMEPCKDLYEKEQQWIQFHERLESIPVMSEMACDTTLPDIRYSVAKYIERKLESLSKQRKIWSKFPVGAVNQNSKNYHFKVSLTARQLIFFFRILLELEILVVGRKKTLFTFIANFIGTPNTDRLELHSLLSKDEIPSQNVIEKVKSVLISMINHINANYR